MKAKKFKTLKEFDWKAGSYVLFDNPKAPILMTLQCGHNFRPTSKWEMKDIEDPEKITLNPSIFCSPQVPCWHGYLRNGEFTEA